MKLYELMKEIRKEEGNPDCSLTIETSYIAHEYGRHIDGDYVTWWGVDGRASDIPAFIAGEKVQHYEVCNGKYFIYI